MALDFAKRKETTRPLAISFDDGEELNIRYRPNRLTLEDVRRLSDLRKELKDADSKEDAAERLEENIAEFESQFLRRVTEWDAVNNGVPVPLTPEGLREAEVDVEVLYRILEEIANAQNVPLQSKRPSETT